MDRCANDAQVTTSGHEYDASTACALDLASPDDLLLFARPHYSLTSVQSEIPCWLKAPSFTLAFDDDLVVFPTAP